MARPALKFLIASAASGRRLSMRRSWIVVAVIIVNTLACAAVITLYLLRGQPLF